MKAIPGAPRKFALGLVIRKFSPLHYGHEWLMQDAAKHCAQVLILSYSNPNFSRCDPVARRRWLGERLPNFESLVIDEEWLSAECQRLGIERRLIPRNNACDESQQSFLAWLLKEVVRRRPDAFFCSESYGAQTADMLSRSQNLEVRAMVNDRNRHHFPISATQIRSDPHRNRQMLSPVVYAAYVRRIALLRGESTGKSTLAGALAAHFKTEWVPEYGRELWEERDGKLSEEDLLTIAKEQIRREDGASRRAIQYIFCDTSPLTTAGYSFWMFNHIQSELASLASREYDAVLLCDPDFPFVQDGTRRDEQFRDRQHAWYLQQAKTLECPFLEVTGSLPDRVATVARWLPELAFD